MFEDRSHPLAIDPKRALVPHIAVAPDLSLLEAAKLMSCALGESCEWTQQAFETGIGKTLHNETSTCALLVEQDDGLVGIVTENDFVRCAARQVRLQDVPVREVMTPNPIVLHEEELTDLFLAYNLMRRHHIRHLPVVDDRHKPVGIVSTSSLRQTLNLAYFLRCREVAEVMHTSPVVVQPGVTAIEAANIMMEAKISSVIVVEATPAGNYPIGVLTEHDLLKMQSLELNLEALKIEDVMSSPVFCLSPSTSLADAKVQMESRKIRRIPIVGRQGELVGILSQSNLVQVLDPMEVYGIIDILQQRVYQLEHSRLKLLPVREADIVLGLEQHQFALHYHPQFHLTPDRALYAVEALLRWQHPEYGDVPPDEFIPVAESGDSIRTLGEWVLERACLQMVAWRQQMSPTLQPPELLTVNISSAQLLEADRFVERFERILARTGCLAEWVVLEVTESALVNDAGGLAAAFQHLRQLGTRIAIDDFRSSHASLGYVQNFPFDILKLDRELIQRLDRDPRAQTAVRSIVQMAHRFELCVVAEGVETAVEHASAIDCGCNVAQGYFYSQPEAANDVVRHFAVR